MKIENINDGLCFEIKVRIEYLGIMGICGNQKYVRTCETNIKLGSTMQYIFTATREN